MRGVRHPFARRPLRFAGARAVTSRPPTARRALRHLGTLGNAAFLVGSVLFLSETSQTSGVWLFILGSAAFLVDGLTRPGGR